MKKLLYLLLFVPVALFGQENYSLSFDANGEYISFQNNTLNPEDELTVSFWAKLNNYGPYNRFITMSPQTESEATIKYNVANNIQGLYVYINGQSYQSDVLPSLGEWHNITLTYSQILNVGKLYLDSELVFQFNDSSDEWLDDADYFYVGGVLSGYFSVDGKMNNINVWNSLLSQEEIQSYMDCPPSGQEDGLVGYWSFNEGIGDTVYDISGNGNQGTIYGATFSEDVPEETCSILDQLNASFDAWNVSIDLSAGWNMFGYGCPSSINVADGLSNHTESIIITKDNNGNVYMPEFGFNGIGDFTPGYGYQIKLTEVIDSFSLCDWYVNNIPEDNIVSLQEDVENLQDQLDSIYGCIDESACNYDETASLDDGSCEYPEQNYDCDGNFLIYVGAEAHGGIVFYYDSIGEYGLVAALEDLGDNNPWGCSNLQIQGADETLIGGGYQNTLDIIAGCSETPIAASKALAYESDGYNDWYLPSIDELIEMYYSIGNGGPYGNIGEFNVYDTYWSSSEIDNNVWYVSFSIGSININNKDVTYSLRPIRAFGNWTMGCMDSLACNYNPEANMADGSCEYAELGYDCDGNSLINCFYPPDPEFVSWLQENTEGVMNGDCLDIDAAADYVAEFFIESTNIIDLDGIHLFTNLSYLDISFNQALDSIGNLSSLQNLSGLFITSNSNLISIGNLSGLSNLTALFIYQNPLLTAVEDISNNNVLTDILIDANGLTSLPDFAGLTNLQYLTLFDNVSLTSLPDFADLTNLSSLTIENNDALTSLPDISGLTNLSDLFIDNNDALECVGGYPEQLTIEESWPPVCEEEVTYQVGDYVEGGIVFYVDETGKGGLVAALEDIGSFYWGCSGDNVFGADGVGFGNGHQNTFDIVDFGCYPQTYLEELNGSEITAAEAALNYSYEGYSDWFLPSKDELVTMFNNIGQVSPNGNIGGFVDFPLYWSSSEYEDYEQNWAAYAIWSIEPEIDSPSGKYESSLVRPIRAFGPNQIGYVDYQICKDSAACNYTPFPLLADSICDFSAQGYNCDGNITEYFVRMEAEGGIVFYVDSTGQHGLVAYSEDIGQMTWDEALEAVNNFSFQNYDDWYLPSVDEFEQMNSSIGPYSPEGISLGDFGISWRWTSDEANDSQAWVYRIISQNSLWQNKLISTNVRPIRSF